MRKTTIKCLNDNMTFDLGREVEPICAVINIGKALDSITYEVTLTGVKLKEFIIDNKLAKSFLNQIIDDNIYVVTAYDW